MTTKTNNTTTVAQSTNLQEIADRQTRNDAIVAGLVVSVAVNAFILTGWVALRVTSQFDEQVATLLFS